MFADQPSAQVGNHVGPIVTRDGSGATGGWLLASGRSPAANAQGQTTKDSNTTRGRLVLRASAAIVNGKLKSWIGWKQFRHFAQALGQGRGGKQGIIALPQVVVVHIEVNREQIDGDCVRESGGQVLVLMLL